MVPAAGLESARFPLQTGCSPSELCWRIGAGLELHSNAVLHPNERDNYNLLPPWSFSPYLAMS